MKEVELTKENKVYRETFEHWLQTKDEPVNEEVVEILSEWATNNEE